MQPLQPRATDVNVLLIDAARLLRVQLFRALDRENTAGYR